MVDVVIIVFSIIGVFVLLGVILLVMFIISKMKGKITIQLEKSEFAQGDVIRGTMSLKLKKSVNAKALNIGILGMQRVSRMTTDSKGRRSRQTSNKVIFKFKKKIDGEKEYVVGEKTYNFDLKIPKDVLKKGTGNAVMDGLVKSAQILSGQSSSVRWYVVANLDIPGFDISKKVQINIG